MFDEEKRSNPATATSWKLMLAWMAALVVCMMAISSQSLWIDESYTAGKAQQVTLQNWWHEMLRGGSDLQMPLYMFWIWICGRIFGSSEIALRAVNLFWLAPGLMALWSALARQPKLQWPVFFVVIFSPFVWYYLDEARPYAMQIGASLFLAAAIFHWSEDASQKSESPWVWGFAAALVALSGASLLGMIWAAAAIAAAIFLTPGEKLFQLVFKHIFALGICLTLLAALGFYYLWTLQAGARATDIATTGWKNILFIAYELFGFAGLGPGRLEIRSHNGGLDVFKPYLPNLVTFAAVMCAMVISAIRFLLKSTSRKTFLLLLATSSAPAIFILSVGFVLHFRVLGRHFAPLFPVVIFILALGVTELWQRRMAGKIFVAAFFALCLVSDFSLRFAPRHKKDDYCSAAHFAEISLEHGEKVWWNANVQAAEYYQLPLTTNSAATSKAIVVVNPSSEFLHDSAPPQIALCSRPDIYDPSGTLANYLTRKKFIKVRTLPAFVIWENSFSR